MFVQGRRLGFEFKRTTAPKFTPSMRSAMESLGLDRLVVLHAGDHVFPLARDVEAWPLVDWLRQRSAASL